MSTRRAATIRVEEGLTNAGAPPQDNKVPPQDNQLLTQDQPLHVSPPMTNGDIR